MGFSIVISILSLTILIFLIATLSFGRSNRYLVGWLAICAALVFMRLAFEAAWPGLSFYAFLVFPSGYIAGFMFWLYVESELFAHNARPFIAFGWGVVALVAIVHCVCFIIFADLRDDAAILQQTDIVRKYTRCIVAGGILVNSLWLALAFKSFFRFERAQREALSLERTRRIAWLRFLLWSNAVLLLSFAAAFAIVAWRDGHTPFTPIESSVTLIVAYAIAFFLIRRPDINLLSRTPRNTANITEPKYIRQNLSLALREKYVSSLDNLMARERIFLDENLSLARVAHDLNIPAHHLSIAINSVRQLNFYQYVNHWRVREAQQLIADSANDSETLLSLALKAGFQSKAGFNRIFKQHVGLTPRAYRERLQAGR
ncbi:MAG: helix-turn-helix transcriptional regulator [Spirochaetes bacterium]|nr:helix-turn-helix transcriptional regulator [Spirochaetota bacterium]